MRVKELVVKGHYTVVSSPTWSTRGQPHLPAGHRGLRVPATTPKPRSRPGRAPKHYLDRMEKLEKEVKRIKTEELEPLELDLEAWHYLVASYEETTEEAAE